ncbi:MAG: hypothetical protein FWF59_02795 [Turicibacter sp.]|nr:hypothetical protein [Turicibacter sp.]
MKKWQKVLSAMAVAVVFGVGAGVANHSAEASIIEHSTVDVFEQIFFDHSVESEKEHARQLQTILQKASQPQTFTRNTAGNESRAVFDSSRTVSTGWVTATGQPAGGHTFGAGGGSISFDWGSSRSVRLSVSVAAWKGGPSVGISIGRQRAAGTTNFSQHTTIANRPVILETTTTDSFRRYRVYTRPRMAPASTPWTFVGHSFTQARHSTGSRIRGL